jgi:imidazolonepropionase-like amidohydrolase
MNVRTSRRCIAIVFLAAAVPALAQDTTVFVNVNVVPMTTRAILARRNVTVAGGRIISIDSAALTRRPSVRVIDGAGRYLVPGLTDAHVHLELDERRWLPVFLSYGVTVGVQPSRRATSPRAASRCG